MDIVLRYFDPNLLFGGIKLTIYWGDQTDKSASQKISAACGTFPIFGDT